MHPSCTYSFVRYQLRLAKSLSWRRFFTPSNFDPFKTLAFLCNQTVKSSHPSMHPFHAKSILRLVQVLVPSLAYCNGTVTVRRVVYSCIDPSPFLSPFSKRKDALQSYLRYVVRSNAGVRAPHYPSTTGFAVYAVPSSLPIRKYITYDTGFRL